MLRTALRRLAAMTRGAVDLASIMVGVLVIGLIAGVISATVFAVIPWAQDRAAAGNLDAVATAESVAKAKDGSYLTLPGLETAGLIEHDDGASVRVGGNGSCYAAFSRSDSGRTFYRTSLTAETVAVPAPWPATPPAGYPGDCEWPLAADAAVASDVVNLFANPALVNNRNSWGFNNPASSGVTTVTTLVPGGAPGGRQSVRTAVTAPAAGTVNIGPYKELDPTAAGYRVAAEGKPHTASMWVRSSRPLTVQPKVEKRDADGVSDIVRGSVSSAALTLASNVWTRVSVIVPASTSPYRLTLTVYTAALPTGGFQTGDSFEASMAMLSEGDTLHDYADGFTPGWTWAGTPGHSVSSGRPYTLASVMGEPAAYLETVGRTELVAAPSHAGRTIYSVYRVATTNARYAPGARLGSDDYAAGAVGMQTGDAGTTVIAPRVDTKNGTANSVLSINNTRVPGTSNILAVVVGDGMTKWSLSDKTGATKSVALTPGDGMTNANTSSPAMNGIEPLAVISQVRAHDPATVTAVTSWLVNHYGID